MLELYTTALSANGRKVLAASRELGLAPRIHEVNVYRGEGLAPDHRARHPLGKIPVLRDAELTLAESNAILIYLSERHAGHRLWSRDPVPRARIASWLFWESSHWQPSLAAILGPTVAHLLGIPGFDHPPDPPDWKEPELIRQLGFLDSSLAGRPFLAGEQLSLADLSVAGMTTYFGATGFPHADYPNVHAWCQRIEALPSWQSTAVPPWSSP